MILEYCTERRPGLALLDQRLIAIQESGKVFGRNPYRNGEWWRAWQSWLAMLGLKFNGGNML